MIRIPWLAATFFVLFCCGSAAAQSLPSLLDAAVSQEDAPSPSDLPIPDSEELPAPAPPVVKAAPTIEPSFVPDTPSPPKTNVQLKDAVPQDVEEPAPYPPCSICLGSEKDLCHGCRQCGDCCCCEDNESGFVFSGGGRDYSDAWRLMGERRLAGFAMNGWVSDGGTGNARNPPSRYNGPVTFNDREDFTLNQLNAVLENPLEADSGWDIGGRIDFMYGTDARFTQAIGLEIDPNGAGGWNNGRSFYHVALPQFYAEVGNEQLAVRMGHFYTIIGHEMVTAPDNFFYSHSYAMQYGEPFTHTGALASYQFNDQWILAGGIHFGWDVFDANIDRASFLGGAFYTSSTGAHQLGVTMTSGDEPSVLNNRLKNRILYSVVWKWAVGERLYYVLQHDNAYQDSGAAPGVTANWYGINQYLFYDINDCWRVGARIEWFNDRHGTRVTGLGAGNPNVGPFAGDFYEVTAGFNWFCSSNVTIRPEVRWDWYDGGGAGPNPFNDGANNSQFLGAIDFIAVW